MTKEEILKRVKKFQGANREFSQELPPIIEGLVDLIDEAGPEVVDNLESNDPDKALSANMGKELNVTKQDAPAVAGEAGQILQLDENGDPEWVEAAAVGATYDSAVSDTSTNAIQNKTIKKYVDDNFAQKNGYYASLTAGAAENLVGRGSVPAEIAFRTSGGDQDLGTGSALITKILGRTLAWNNISDVASNSGVSTGARTGIGNSADVTRTYYASHKYFFSVRITTLAANDRIWLWGGNRFIFVGHVTNSLWTGIYSPTVDQTRQNDFSLVGNYDSDPAVTGTVSFDDLFVVDLTAMYGAGNEPATVEQFRALHPLLYYTPASKLINNAATGLETTGFNQYNPTTGTAQVIAGQTYYIGGTYTSISQDGETITPENHLFTPANTGEVVVVGGNDTDTIINLSWSGYRNGEYEPYEKHTLNLGLDNLACHDEDDNAVVVNGLDGVGTSKDELVVENGWGTRIIKRRGRRAYQAGDESDATLMTDGTNTDYPLPSPLTLTLDTPIPASYYVNDFGTEARLPQDTADDPQAPFCAEIQYAMNSVDTLRRLPSQYISDESMTNILTALKTAGIIANFTLTYDSEHQYFTCSVTAPITEGE